MTIISESNAGRKMSNSELIVEDVETLPAKVVKIWTGHPVDATRGQWMKLTESSGAYDFWNHPDEDIYSENDGVPI